MVTSSIETLFLFLLGIREEEADLPLGWTYFLSLELGTLIWVKDCDPIIDIFNVIDTVRCISRESIERKTHYQTLVIFIHLGGWGKEVLLKHKKESLCTKTYTSAPQHFLNPGLVGTAEHEATTSIKCRWQGLGLGKRSSCMVSRALWLVAKTLVEHTWLYKNQLPSIKIHEWHLGCRNEKPSYLVQWCITFLGHE